MRFSKLATLAVAGLGLAHAGQAGAAVITLSGGDAGEGFAPLPFVFGAVDFPTTTAGAGTVQNVTFNTNAGAFTATAPAIAPTSGGGANYVGTTTNDNNLRNVFNDAVFANPGPIALTITGLQSGVAYQIDSFVGATGSNFLAPTGRSQTVAVFSGTSTTGPLATDTFDITAPATNGATSPAFDVRQTFTLAEGVTTATVRYTSTFPLLNAVAVTTAVPEPGAIALLGVGAVALAGRRRRRQVCPA